MIPAAEPAESWADPLQALDYMEIHPEDPGNQHWGSVQATYRKPAQYRDRKVGDLLGSGWVPPHLRQAPQPPQGPGMPQPPMPYPAQQPVQPEPNQTRPGQQVGYPQELTQPPAQANHPPTQPPQAEGEKPSEA